jgi:hypothetical protein
MKGFRKNGYDHLSSRISTERRQQVERKATQEIFNIHLSELRKSRNIKQSEITAFSQSGLSKLESRKDMKISTLIDYLQSIGMGLEIKCFPAAGKHSKKDEVVLVKA